jgi:hypothetical protein
VGELLDNVPNTTAEADDADDGSLDCGLTVLAPKRLARKTFVFHE